MSNNQRQQIHTGQEPRRNQLANRNASTFNPISFNPENQTNIDDYEKAQKKEKQAAYRNQLDNMALARGRDQRTNEKSGEEHLEPAQREAEQRYVPQAEDNQRQLDEETYLQEQYKKMAEYERYQQQMDEMEKNYNKASYPYQDASEGYNRPVQESRSQQHEYQQYEQHTDLNRNLQRAQEERPQQYANQQYGQQQSSHQQSGYQHGVNRSPEKPKEEVSTFQQQDNQREQLLNKIKGGYSQQNSNVWSSYQRAYEAKEKDKREFEQSLVNKAAQDRQREDVRAMTEWEKKRKMQQEAADVNRRAAEMKAIDKRRQKADDAALENQRNQDSLSQFERERYLQKETQKRMKEDANRVLEQQMKDAHIRKLDKEHNVTMFGHPAHNVSNQPYYNERGAKTPLVPSYSQMNQAQPTGKNIEALDNLSLQMDKLAMKGSYGREEDYNQGYKQNQYPTQQYGGDQGRLNYENPVPKGSYEDYNQGYKANQYPSQQYGGELRSQTKNQESQPRHDFGNAAEYQKNRLKARNTGYNIITGDFR